MVITSPFSSIQGYVVSKPPLVLFTLCLIGFAITTFSFAYYVERNETLPDIDAKRQLDSFLAHLSKQLLCVTNDVVTLPKSDSLMLNSSEFNEISINVAATLEQSPFPKNITNVEGIVKVSDWASECSSLPVEKIKIAISFENEPNQTYSEHICVQITGPRFLLESGDGDNQCIFTPKSKLKNSVMEHINISVNELRSCSESKPLKFTYIRSNYNAVTLSQHDRSVINLHLFHTSYFLLVMAITLICYAMIKGKPISNKHQSMEKVPLEV